MLIIMEWWSSQSIIARPFKRIAEAIEAPPKSSCHSPKLLFEVRICEIAETRIRYGYRRVHVLLRRDSWRINHKRTYRIYCQEELHLRRRRPHRHISSNWRTARPEVERPNACWSMDFVVASLFNGQRFRALTVFDNYCRERLAIEAEQGMTGDDVEDAIESLVQQRGAPDRIQYDNGSEFISWAMDKWAYDHRLVMDFSRLSEPMDNVMVDSINESFRDECLNFNWFLSMVGARKKIEKRRQDYNEFPAAQLVCGCARSDT